jgi:hypothetical protein
MSSNNIDFEAQQAGFMTIDWLREAVKEIDTIFGQGFSKNNPSLIGNFIQAASRKYQASILNEMVHCLDSLVESIGCDSTNPVEFWRKSDIAANDKAKELGINILPKYSMDDLRYKIYCAIQEVN